MEAYESPEPLGEGAYACVWKCVERATRRHVAIKSIKHAHEEPEIMRLAVREVRVLQSLQHPAIIPLIDAFKSKSGKVYMVFPYVGCSAYQMLTENLPDGFPEPRLKVLTWQLLQALVYLHKQKVVHRDVKPGNILLSNSGQVHLCDFGFARPTQCAPREVQPLTSYVVTRWYRAPEVIVDERYGPSCDIWSLGCTIAELATGRPLFPGKSSGEQLWRIMRCLGPLPESQRAHMAAHQHLARVRVPVRGRSLRFRLQGCDPELLWLLEGCLKLEPSERATAAELLRLPYFAVVPQLLAGTPLERIYSGLKGPRRKEQQQKEQARVKVPQDSRQQLRSYETEHGGGEAERPSLKTQVSQGSGQAPQMVTTAAVHPEQLEMPVDRASSPLRSLKSMHVAQLPLLLQRLASGHAAASAASMAVMVTGSSPAAGSSASSLKATAWSSTFNDTPLSGSFKSAAAESHQSGVVEHTLTTRLASEKSKSAVSTTNALDAASRMLNTSTSFTHLHTSTVQSSLPMNVLDTADFFTSLVDNAPPDTKKQVKPRPPSSNPLGNGTHGAASATLATTANDALDELLLESVPGTVGPAGMASFASLYGTLPSFYDQDRMLDNLVSTYAVQLLNPNQQDSSKLACAAPSQGVLRSLTAAGDPLVSVSVRTAPTPVRVPPTVNTAAAAASQNTYDVGDDSQVLVQEEDLAELLCQPSSKPVTGSSDSFSSTLSLKSFGMGQQLQHSHLKPLLSRLSTADLLSANVAMTTVPFIPDTDSSATCLYKSFDLSNHADMVKVSRRGSSAWTPPMQQRKQKLPADVSAGIIPAIPSDSSLRIRCRSCNGAQGLEFIEYSTAASSCGSAVNTCTVAASAATANATGAGQTKGRTISSNLLSNVLLDMEGLMPPIPEGATAAATSSNEVSAARAATAFTRSRSGIRIFGGGSFKIQPIHPATTSSITPSASLSAGVPAAVGSLKTPLQQVNISRTLSLSMVEHSKDRSSLQNMRTRLEADVDRLQMSRTQDMDRGLRNDLILLPEPQQPLNKQAASTVQCRKTAIPKDISICDNDLGSGQPLSRQVASNSECNDSVRMGAGAFDAVSVAHDNLKKGALTRLFTAVKKALRNSSKDRTRAA